MTFSFDDDGPPVVSVKQASQSTVQPQKAPVLVNLEKEKYARSVSSTVVWTPKCLPTYVPGFDDQLIFLVYENGEEKPGGLPLGTPALTTVGGDPGTGKSTFCYAVAAGNLEHGEHVQFHTFEKPPWEVMYHILRMIDAYGYKNIKVEKNNGRVSIPNFDLIDEHHSEQRKKTMVDVVNHIKTWHERTKGRLVIMDSLTMMTSGEALPERQLGLQLRNFIYGIGQGLSASDEMAILGTSQHRGNYRDAHFAGGPAIAHHSAAVIKIDADFVDSFNKGYYGLPKGTLVHSIRVMKTANHPQSHFEHFLTIYPNGKCEIGEAIATVAMRCRLCGEYINPEKDAYSVIPKSGMVHEICKEAKKNGTGIKLK
jgi:KaiC/GvpD/RAD55 family RecA-like ATPase